MKKKENETGRLETNSNTVGGKLDVTSTHTLPFNNWFEPEFLSVEVVGKTIEMIYKETSMITHTTYPQAPPEERVFKIIYSCVEGKWNVSERIYGNIIKATEETYEFLD